MEKWCGVYEVVISSTQNASEILQRHFVEMKNFEKGKIRKRARKMSCGRKRTKALLGVLDETRKQCKDTKCKYCDFSAPTRSAVKNHEQYHCLHSPGLAQVRRSFFVINASNFSFFFLVKCRAEQSRADKGTSKKDVKQETSACASTLSH